MSAAERAYRLLLRAYPGRFRAKFGREMAQLFEERHRDARLHRTGFWVELIADVARSAPALRLEEWRARRDEHHHIEEGSMKTMAILAILVGAMEVVNSGAEAWVGGFVLHGGYSLIGGAMGAVAGAFLVISAIAVLRRSLGAAALARRAAVSCLTVFVFIAALRPMFSMFATIMGIILPAAMLLVLRRENGSGPSVPATTH